MGQGHRAAGADLPLEDRDHRAVGAQDVAETDGHELRAAVRNGVDDDLRQALAGAHHVGGVHRLVRGDEDKALHIAFHGDLRGLVCAEDVVQDRLLRTEFHERNMLMGRGVDHDVRFILSHDPPEGFLVPDGTDLENHGIADQLPELLLELEEEVVHVVLRDIVKNQLGRGESQDLPAELRSDGSSAAGNQNNLPGEICLDLGHVQVLLRAAQQVRDVHFPGLRAFPDAGVDENVASCFNTGIEERGQIPLRRGDRDDDLIDPVFADGVFDIAGSAHHRHPGDGGTLFVRIVVQDRHGGAVSVPAVLYIPDNRCSGISCADYQDSLYIFPRLPFHASGASVPHEETGTGDQEQCHNPLNEVHRPGHQHYLRLNRIGIDAGHQGYDQTDDVCASGPDQGCDNHLEKCVCAGILQQALIDSAQPECKQCCQYKKG